MCFGKVFFTWKRFQQVSSAWAASRALPLSGPYGHVIGEAWTHSQQEMSEILALGCTLFQRLYSSIGMFYYICSLVCVSVFLVCLEFFLCSFFVYNTGKGHNLAIYHFKNFTNYFQVIMTLNYGFKEIILFKYVFLTQKRTFYCSQPPPSLQIPSFFFFCCCDKNF